MSRRLVPALVLLTPVVEIVVLVLLGRSFGWLPTLLALLALSLVGMAVVRRVGRRAWTNLQATARSGQPPTSAVDDAMLFAGGLVLAVPGFATDLLALPLLLPFTRPLLRRRMSAYAVRRGAMTVRVAPRGPAGHGGPTGRGGPDVVRGEVVDEGPA